MGQADHPINCRARYNRAKTVDIRYRLPSKGSVTDVVIDATGLKVFGGEWKQRKCGK